MNLRSIVRSLTRKGRDTGDGPVEMHSALDDWLGQAQERKVQSQGFPNGVDVSEEEARQDVEQPEMMGPQHRFGEEVWEGSETSIRPFVGILEETDVQELVEECQGMVALLGARRYLPQEESE